MIAAQARKALQDADQVGWALAAAWESEVMDALAEDSPFVLEIYMDMALIVSAAYWPVQDAEDRMEFLPCSSSSSSMGEIKGDQQTKPLGNSGRRAVHNYGENAETLWPLHFPSWLRRSGPPLPF